MYKFRLRTPQLPGSNATTTTTALGNHKLNTTMKYFVPIGVLLLMFSFSASSDTISTSEAYSLINATNLAKPGCDSRCGDVTVPYPFGIGIDSNCSAGEEFDIHCNTSLDPPKASIKDMDYYSIKQISDSTLRISNFVASECFSLNDPISKPLNINFPMESPYTFSQVNKFTGIGCDDVALLYSLVGTENRQCTSIMDCIGPTGPSTGCLALCSKRDHGLVDKCSGNGCCQTSIPKGMNNIATALNTLQDPGNGNYTNDAYNHCTYAFVGEENVFEFNRVDDFNNASFRNMVEANVPIVLDWAIGNLSCPEAEAKKGIICQSNSKCVNSTRRTGGYRCMCKEGYEGNPYLYPGCQDINECEDVSKFPCYGTCVNTPGNYTCKCKQGYSGDAKIKDGCRHNPFPVLQLSLGLGLGFLAILIGLPVLYFTVAKRKLVKQKEKFFEQNGGLLLKEKLSTKGGVSVNSMKIFCVEELEEATRNFAEDRVLGKGGYGTVYKGTLPDKRVVAIKKSQRLDHGQREQFINEMVILTQINHQNVVQLLGCCLETDVPLLVYEFVSNGTLYHHIQNRSSGIGRLSWDDRLRIAHESAGALAYLHTDARMPIIHRDVKSTNILLDDSYTAKIADFGASRLVPLGHDQVTTLVQGTLGYLDPEYFHTGQLSDRSDVYSFGVVLAELLTSMKAITEERSLEERNLAIFFVKAMKENRFLEILEHHLVNEATNEQLKATCDLVCRCVNQVGEKRPNMKEVTMELQKVKKIGNHPWATRDNYNEMSSLMIESEETDIYTPPLTNNSDTFGEGGSSGTGMKDMMHQVQSPR